MEYWKDQSTLRAEGACINKEQLLNGMLDQKELNS